MITNAMLRKSLPLARGLLDYFPDACCEVAALSMIGNEQHNPGQEMHWDRSKSTDHADCIIRHLVDRGTKDVDRVRHSAKVAWRALALLQLEIEHDRANAQSSPEQSGSPKSGSGTKSGPPRPRSEAAIQGSSLQSLPPTPDRRIHGPDPSLPF